MKLDEQTLWLIAIGASVTANCQPCLQTNVGKARESGLGEQAIAEAIEVGKRVRAGAASKMDRFALDLNQPSIAGANAAGCDCT